MPHSEVVIDEHHTPVVINTSPASVPDITGALRNNGELKIADALGRWINKVAPPTTRRKGRFGGILDRDKFLAPECYFDKVRLAREALRDDVVGGAADGTEALAVDRVGVECDDVYQEDVWNQIMGDLNMDDQLRKHWRGLYTDSTAVVALWWGTKTYTPRLKAKVAKARKEYRLQVPIGVTFLDPTKIVPVGQLMFGQADLCYQAEPLEAALFDLILAQRDGVAPPARTPGELPPLSRPPGAPGAGTSVVRYQPQTIELPEAALSDPIVQRLIVGRYIPNPMEVQELYEDGVEDCSRLYLLDRDSVFRSTATNLDYQRFPDCRLESVFELLDLKAQLRQMDRVHLIGGAHMIILITKGTDADPALPEEVSALRASATTIASVPLIVGDHRLHVEIITPRLDVTLDRAKHDTIDFRLFARSWGSFIPTGQDLSDPTKIGTVIGRNVGSRRKMMRRSWETHMFQQVRDRNPDLMTERAKLVFQPANVSLAFDQAWASFLLDLRQGGDISHGTTLGEFGMSVADEARKVQREREAYGPLFRENAPFNPFGPNPGSGGEDGEDDDGDPGGDGTPPTRVARRSGGRRAGGSRGGGGAAPGSGQGQEPTGRSRSGGGRRARTQDTSDDEGVDDDE